MTMSSFKKTRYVVYWVIIFFYLFFLRNTLDVVSSGIMIGVGLLIAIESSELAVESIDIFAKKFHLSPYVGGVLSSLASNTPELVIGAFAVLNGQTEFAIALITIATGFNILMLGLLIIIGNRIRKGPIHLPPEVIEVEVPIMRVAIVILGSIFVIGTVEFIQEVFLKVQGSTETNLVPKLPHEAALLMVLIYLFYLAFIIRHNINKNLESERKHKNPSGTAFPSPVADHEHSVSKYALAGLLFLSFA